MNALNDKNMQEFIMAEIERLQHANAEMRCQMEHEINKNNLMIYALQQLLKSK